jgi:hypothetical protein
MPRRQHTETGNNNGLPRDNQFMLAILSIRATKNRSIIYAEGFELFRVVYQIVLCFFQRRKEKKNQNPTQKQKEEETAIKCEK